VSGPGCSCLPPDASPPVEAGQPTDGSTDGSGPGCWIGYNFCALNTWCQLGVCQDSGVQYGCYCNADGTADCKLTCPPPPPCYIPGFGSCPVNTSCDVGQCPDGGGPISCYCYGGGGYSCNSSCTGAEGGTLDAAPPPDASTGPGCWLEGYQFCPSGTFCAIGTCEDNVTQYGCFCNADGTADCKVDCPAPQPCHIPNYGDCPVNTTCVVGKCPDGGSDITCSCELGGSYYCNGSCN
jgi:hypothetical protein